MRIGLISDTHGRLRPQVYDAFDGVDLILHAGDVGPIDIITDLETVAPVHAVMGNTDSPALMPRVQDEVRLELEGHAVVVVHGHRLGAPTAALLRAAYPDANVIVYGHTHRQRVDNVDGCLVVNPGAAGAARFGLKPSVTVLELAAGEAAKAEVVELT
ncbi:metallophosphoesterase family protein [soil metagenome]